jgi:hypothetical protein
MRNRQRKRVTTGDHRQAGKQATTGRRTLGSAAGAGERTRAARAGSRSDGLGAPWRPAKAQLSRKARSPRRAHGRVAGHASASQHPRSGGSAARTRGSGPQPNPIDPRFPIHPGARGRTMPRPSQAATARGDGPNDLLIYSHEGRRGVNTGGRTPASPAAVAPGRPLLIRARRSTDRFTPRRAPVDRRSLPSGCRSERTSRPAPAAAPRRIERHKSTRASITNPTQGEIKLWPTLGSARGLSSRSLARQADCCCQKAARGRLCCRATWTAA